MSSTLRTISIIAILVYFIVVFRLLKKGRLALKHTLLWLLMGMVMAILVFFPDLLVGICTLCGIADGMNGLFTFSIGFILCLLMSLTAIVSKQSDRIKNLVQDNALLEKRIRELEERL